jgi:RNA polymerase sigma-70 factor (ECF subfamily)
MLVSDEAALVKSALDGSQTAYSKLMALHKTSVYNLALRMAGNEEDAVDLTQETFIKAFRSLPTFDPGRPFRWWVLKIASNTCIDFLRKKRPEFVSTEGLEVEEPAPGPGENLEKKRLRSKIEHALEALPENLRAAILLRHVEGLSYEQIAEALGVPMGTVKTWIRRGRELLKSRLGP